MRVVDTNNMANTIVQIGNIVVEKNFQNPQIGRVYSAEGICPTLNTCQGGGREPKVLVKVEVENEK